MFRFSISRSIAAPVERVFGTVADVHNFARAIPDIVRAEIVSEVRAGVGTRFRETRRIAGHETTTELEVTELVDNHRLRIVADTHGTVWDSLFTVRSAPGRTDLTLTLEARPHSLAARLTSAMAQPMVRKALERDLDALKAYCERD